MRQMEQAVEQAELVHDLERGGMDGVAAEVAVEVGMLFEHGDINAGAGEQQAEHHAGGAAAYDAAGGGQLIRRGLVSGLMDSTVRYEMHPEAAAL